MHDANRTASSGLLAGRDETTGVSTWGTVKRTGLREEEGHTNPVPVRCLRSSSLCESAPSVVVRQSRMPSSSRSITDLLLVHRGCFRRLA